MEAPALHAHHNLSRFGGGASGGEDSAALPPVKCLITGAAGQIAYSLAFLVAGGAAFGAQRRVVLHLLDVPLPGIQDKLDALRMELEDTNPALLVGVVATTDYAVAFADVDVALLVGARPRGPGMERKDLLEANAGIFRGQGAALDAHAKRSVLVLVVGNPANTNALIVAQHAPRLARSQISCLTRLDQNRAAGMLARRISDRLAAAASPAPPAVAASAVAATAAAAAAAAAAAEVTAAAAAASTATVPSSQGAAAPAASAAAARAAAAAAEAAGAAAASAAADLALAVPASAAALAPAAAASAPASAASAPTAVPAVMAASVKNVIVWGNHSSTQFPDARLAVVSGFPRKQDSASVLSLLGAGGADWLRGAFVEAVQQRGKAVIDKRGLSSAASAAQAIADCVRDWWLGSGGNIVSMGVYLQAGQGGEGGASHYGLASDLVFSLPVVCEGRGVTRVVGDLSLDEFARDKLRAMQAELLDERSLALPELFPA